MDASALVEFILQTPRARPVEATIRDSAVDLHTPALCDVEFASALRRALREGLIQEERSEEALGNYLDLPITRHGHQLLLPRILDLRHNLSAYDAAYVALAERLDAELLTGDGALAAAAREHVGIRIVRPPS
ncbi:MAG TPA: type II toxin-antitoxin system VapC family toxin [Actinomycetota bacterium]|nr:type II toxin-antitoxin system VapC family toxin [Actinomycetota bacterium]